jgi:cytochrome c556
MFRATLLATIFALCGTGLIAQDDLAQYQEHMKAAVAANRALGAAVKAGDTAGVTTNAANLVTQFDWIATFWQGKGKTDAVNFAKAASAAAKATGDAKTPEDMAAASAKIAPNCGGCHAVYRNGTAFKGM